MQATPPWPTDVLRAVLCFAVDSFEAWVSLQCVSSHFRFAAKAPHILAHIELVPTHPQMIVQAVGARRIKLSRYVVAGTMMRNGLLAWTHTLSEFLSRLPPNLDSLYMSGEVLHDLHDLGRLASLRTLCLRRCTIFSLDGIDKLTKIQSLDIEEMGYLTPAALRKYLASVPGLQALSLRFVWSHTNEDYLSSVAAMKGLRRLELRECEISDLDIQLLSSLPLLEELRMTSCPISDRALLDVAKMPSLRVVNLCGCRQLSMKSLDVLRSRPGLTVITNP